MQIVAKHQVVSTKISEQFVGNQLVDTSNVLTKFQKIVCQKHNLSAKTQHVSRKKTKKAD